MNKTYRSIEIDDCEIDVEVRYSYTAAQRGRMYLRNGDPGYPDEPAEVEILEVIALENLTGYKAGSNIISIVPESVLDQIEDDILGDSNDN